jgi:hypothetical protein
MTWKKLIHVRTNLSALRKVMLTNQIMRFKLKTAVRTMKNSTKTIIRSDILIPYRLVFYRMAQYWHQGLKMSENELYLFINSSIKSFSIHFFLSLVQNFWWLFWFSLNSTWKHVFDLIFSSILSIIALIILK